MGMTADNPWFHMTTMDHINNPPTSDVTWCACVLILVVLYVGCVWGVSDHLYTQVLPARHTPHHHPRDGQREISR